MKLEADGRLEKLLALSLDEDLGGGDVTTLATVPAALPARAVVRALEPCVVAGLELFGPLVAAFARRARTEEEADSLHMVALFEDGERAGESDVVCRIEGTARAILTLERTFLNYLARLSGIATLTAAFVEAAEAGRGGVRVLDTRKTTPGHRWLEKYAVRCGGGTNHRFGLFDGVLIKDNHIAAAGGTTAAVQRARAAGSDTVEVECDDLEQVAAAIQAGADAVLLDNFAPSDVREAVALIGGRARVEVSGGVTLDTIGALANAGADDVSVGRITHSAPSIDLSLEVTTLR